MIQADNTIFPNNVVELVAIPMAAIDPDVMLYKRPLRNTDGPQAIGLSAAMWAPDPESLEMRGGNSTAPQLPTLQTYTYTAQSYIKDANEERGLADHAYLAHAVRSVLYTHTALRVALAQLKVEYENDLTESFRRWGIRTARYFSGEIDSINLYLCTLEFWVETETH